MTLRTRNPARAVFRFAVAAAATGGILALAGGIWMASQGISTRPEPGRLETSVARRARHLLIPASAGNLESPQPSSPDSVRNGLDHFADHCAGCHGNDGGGNTALGRSLYPRAPDMRLPATQDLSDGELFYIIEHGVRLTGMPGLGNGTLESEQASWQLVHFVRHLPRLTADELEHMRALNPRSADEWRQEEEERRFLAGEREPLRSRPALDQPGGPR